MSRRSSRAAAVVAAVLSLSLLGAACSKKVDRDGTKKLMLQQLKDSGVSDETATCVANVLDEFSDDELTKLNDEFEKNTNAEPSALAKTFQEKTVSCATASATSDTPTTAAG